MSRVRRRAARQPTPGGNVRVEVQRDGRAGDDDTPDVGRQPFCQDAADDRIDRVITVGSGGSNAIVSADSDGGEEKSEKEDEEREGSISRWIRSGSSALPS